ncbi:MAG TPA: cytosine permease [Actinomycetota bacterium]|jgi:putative hydroxymethylpyrimidine transporter CytX
MSIAERVDALPDPGIKPVPPEHRVLSGFDLAVLWGDLGVGLLVLVTGAYLVPALGFAQALVAIVLGSIVGVALLALGASAGADYGVPTMVLFRPVLGVRGSWVPSALNALQLVGWTAVELWAISFVADEVAQTTLGFSARWLWLGVAAVFVTALALWGPVGVARVWLKRFGAWVTASICVAVSVLVLTSDGIGAALGAAGTGGYPTFGPALDLVIAMPVSWLPLVADYTRFARGPRGAWMGTSAGYLLANVWLYSLGAMLVLGAGATPSPDGIAAGVLALAGGSIAGALFLVGLLAGETDGAFADVYSGAVSLQNVWPRLSQRSLVVAVAVAGTVLAAWLTMDRYIAFLLLIGSVFVPLFGLLAARNLSSRRSIEVPELYGKGAYWYDGGVRLAAFAPWIAGVLVFHWVAPTGPSWWIDLVTGVAGTPLSEKWGWLSASIPAFLVSFTLALLVRERPSRSEPRSAAV